jgi:hypothetical protein
MRICLVQRVGIEFMRNRVIAERVWRWVGWTRARPAGESGGGLAPTTALQNAGARFGKRRGKSATLWSAAMERQRIRRFGFGAFKPAYPPE